MKPTVLIADDDPQLLAMLEEVLSKDFTVITARSGASALTQFRRNAVDIALTDLAMPSFNGLQVAAKCKAAKPSVPILMLTAWDVLLSDEDLADAGVDDVLAKPVLVHQLSGRLQKLLAAQSSRSKPLHIARHTPPRVARFSTSSAPKS